MSSVPGVEKKQTFYNTILTLKNLLCQLGFLSGLPGLAVAGIFSGSLSTGYLSFLAGLQVSV